MSHTIRYSLRLAFIAGEKRHPQVVMDGLNIKCLESIPYPMADCWVFKVENIPENIPKFMRKDK